MSTEHQERAELARRIAARLSVPPDRIEDMLARSGALREICDEYDACRVAIDRWSASERIGHDRVEEFAALAGDLEAEITRLIAKHPEDTP